MVTAGIGGEIFDGAAGSAKSARAEGFLRHRGLIAFSAGCAIAEVAALTVLAPAARSLAPQVIALRPLAVFHDLRWLFGCNRSWLQFAAGVVILLAGRAALNTIMVELAWPRGLRAPRPAVTFAVSMAFTLMAGILLIPITTLVFGVALVPFSWPFLAAVPVLLAIALPLSPGSSRWRGWPGSSTPGLVRADRRGGAAAPAAAPATASAAGLVIAGFGSSCCQAFLSLRGTSGMTVEQFSYRGLNAAGKPITQGRAASNLPMQALGDMIATHVWHLHAQTGGPVDLVAESEGSLGVYAMLARHRGVPVGSVVLLSPIVAPGQVSFSPAGRQGPGVAAGYALGILDRLVGGFSPFGAAGAERLIDSVSSVGAQYAAAHAVQVMSERWLAVVPLADAVTLPACSLPQNVLFVPALHGGLLGDPAVLTTVRSFLGGREVSDRSSPREAAQILSAAAAAWRMPVRSAPSPPCPQ